MKKKDPKSLKDRAKQTLESLIEACKDTEAASCHLFLFANRGSTKADQWKRLRLTDGLNAAFKARLLSNLTGTVIADREITAFDFDELVGRHIGVIETSEIPEMGTWLNEVPSADWPHLFHADEPFMKKVRFQATTISNLIAGKPLRIFRSRSKSSLLRTGGFNAIFSKLQNEFSLVKGNVFEFSLDVDFFEVDGLTFIINLQSFESLTNIRQVTFTKAQDAVAALENIGGLEVKGLAEVKQQIAKRPQMARKLAAAFHQGTIEAIQPDALAARIGEKKLPLVTTTGPSNQVVITVDHTDSEQVAEFINLVTDAYLSSKVTQKEYKVHAKSPA